LIREQSTPEKIEKLSFTRLDDILVKNSGSEIERYQLNVGVIRKKYEEMQVSGYAAKS
jgi:hypothetical protein